MKYKVHKVAHWVPTSIIGTDEQGRTLVTCPTCHEPAPMLDDGTIACPIGEAEAKVLRAAMRALPLPWSKEMLA